MADGAGGGGAADAAARRVSATALASARAAAKAGGVKSQCCLWVETAQRVMVGGQPRRPTRQCGQGRRDKETTVKGGGVRKGKVEEGGKSPKRLAQGVGRDEHRVREEKKGEAGPNTGRARQPSSEARRMKT